MSSDSIRLQKFLSERGVASRRKAEAIIAAGQVSVNGDIVDAPGTKVDPTVDKVCVLGKPVPAGRPKERTIVFYKPRGVICSRASQRSRTVYDVLPAEMSSLLCAGRLDKDSEGLLILSNSGELIERLTHPRHGQKKVYNVTVSGQVSREVLSRLGSRMVIDGYRIQPVGISILREGETQGRTILEFTLSEGRNRQIRKMCAQVNLRIHRLVRVRAGKHTLKGLQPGEWREVN